jgi:AraC-like DNA-binding protein
VQRASELLARTSESVTNVCFRTGFNDRSYFSRVFRKLTGVTPTQFRKKSKSSQ